jgi:Xaa-Pro aminopeptidase
LGGTVFAEEPDYALRMSALRQSILSKGLGAFLFTHLPNIRYLCGFTGSAGALLVAPQRSVLFTDSRYEIQAGEEVRAARVRITRKSLLGEATRLLHGRKLRAGFETAQLTVAQRAELGPSSLKGLHWIPAAGMAEELRGVKDATELRHIREAARIICDAMSHVWGLVRPGVREREIAAELDYQMRRLGASGPAFETIVAAGEHSAWPHARPGERRIGKNELVVMDAGAILRGYSSDLTRTVYVGRAPLRVKKWYKAVLEAQEAGRQAALPGIAAGDVDAAARRVLRKYKLERYFGHSLGHGLGLEIHEPPRLGRRVKTPLRAGNVVTLEPGVYVEGIGGIRVEDDIVIKDGGAEVLTPLTREFIEI